MPEAPELLVPSRCLTGENPLWHAAEAKVYWADIPRGHVHRCGPDGKGHEICYEGEVTGGFTIQADGALLLFQARGAVRRWAGKGEETVVREHLPGEESNRFNDVIADPEGRVFAGTVGSGGRLGALYRFDLDGTFEQLVTGVGCSNGLGFSPDRTRMYYTDSPKREIYVFDYDRASGAVANRRVWVKVPESPGEGVPDGLTVDAESFVWSARWDGNALVRYDPDGREVRRVPFPCRKVSSAVFGGPAHDTLYVTTAIGKAENEPTEGPGAGGLFRFHPGVKGVAEFPSRLPATA